jgi:hypothetical protein
MEDSPDDAGVAETGSEHEKLQILDDEAGILRAQDGENGFLS